MHKVAGGLDEFDFFPPPLRRSRWQVASRVALFPDTSGRMSSFNEYERAVLYTLCCSLGKAIQVGSVDLVFSEQFVDLKVKGRCDKKGKKGEEDWCVRLDAMPPRGGESGGNVGSNWSGS